jgi:pimeloyl-CoA synthetase
MPRIPDKLIEQSFFYEVIFVAKLLDAILTISQKNIDGFQLIENIVLEEYENAKELMQKMGIAEDTINSLFEKVKEQKRMLKTVVVRLSKEIKR